MRHLTKAFLLLIFFVQPSFAQSPEWNAAQIKQHLEKLNVLGSVLYLAAHPDDENTRLLAFLSNGKLYRTAYLSCTRGDGGQNLIGDEQGEEMGLLRTQELLAARRIDGAEQFFTRANDFGFSKSADETLRFWGHQRILADVVWVIRKFRPDVIICRFPADSRAGHGNHWASAILAHEAFIAAADATKFPEQLKYVKAWQAKRLLWNTFNFGGTNTTSNDQFHINAGGFNPLLGESYGEIAADSRSMHKSQGFGIPRSRGEDFEYFTTIAGKAPQNSLMDGVNTTWSRTKGSDDLTSLIENLNANFDMDDPGKSVPALLKIYDNIQHVQDQYWKKEKSKEVLSLITSCLGLYLEADATDAAAVPGQKLSVRIQMTNRSDIPVQVEKLFLAGNEFNMQENLKNDITATTEKTITISDTTKISQPYWLWKDHPIGYYEIPNQQLVGKPENDPPVNVKFQLKIGDENITVSRPVIYKFTDPVRGEVYQPLVVAPPVTVNVENKVYLFTSTQAQTVRVQLKSFMDNVNGKLHLQVPDNYQVKENDLPFQLNNGGDEATLLFTVSLKNQIDTSASQEMKAIATFNSKQYDRGYKTIAYSHIPTITLFPPAQAKLVAINLKTDGKNIGYIMGAGDMVPEALRQCGYHVTMLSPQNISTQNLSQYDAIITGVRAYNVDKQLKFAQDKLLQYVKDGGALVVQYNNNRGLATNQLGPYPFNITRDRVTEEDAAVTFLNPQNPAFHYPNEITQKDFDGWIQERGLYFASNVDPHYTKLFSMHDTGDDPLDGSTIVTRYGKGKYVYTCLDFFRELPAGVPGAYRLFVNFISPIPKGSKEKP